MGINSDREHTCTHTHTHIVRHRERKTTPHPSLRNKREKATGEAAATHTHTHSRNYAQTEQNSIRLLWRAEGDEARGSKRASSKVSKFKEREQNPQGGEAVRV